MRVVISVGGKFHAFELASQLAKRGYLERIITTKSWYSRGKVPRSQCTAILAPEMLGILMRKVAPLRRRGYYSYVKDNLFDALARRYIPPCDIFHAWGNYAYISIPYARKYGAKVIIERGSTHPAFQDSILREEQERRRIHTERAHPQIIEKGLLEIELADRVIIPSDFVRRSFVEHGVDPAKLTVIPYGIDLSLFSAGRKKDAVFRVLFVGNISVQKGVPDLLDAWRRLSLPGGELVLVGTVDEEMKRLVASRDDSVRLAGHVPHENIRTYFADASLFILPSLQEGSALVTYEAMACGLPSIVSAHTGAVVRDGLDGFVIPIRSPDAIVEKILWMHDHPDEAAAMGNNAREYIQQFTWERYAERVVDVYRELLAGRWEVG